MIAQVMHWLLGVLAALGYPGIAAAVGLESMGLPIPGETTLLAASYLASTGHFSLPLVIAAAAAGAIVGDSLGYLFGRLGGRALIERYGPWVGLSRRRLVEAEGRFARHGARTVFLARFVTVLRVLAGPLAGAARMPYRRFLVANAAGGVTWAATMGTLGFYFGKSVAVLGWWALGAYAAYLVVGFVVRRYTGSGREPDSRTRPTDETGDGRKTARRQPPSATGRADGPEGGRVAVLDAVDAAERDGGGAP